MDCPVDGSELRIADRGGVEIDYCPKCRGVWLDRGELDKIIERSATTTEPRASAAGATTQPLSHAPDRPRDAHYDREYDPRKKKKRGGFLEDLFDFG